MQDYFEFVEYVIYPKLRRPQKKPKKTYYFENDLSYAQPTHYYVNPGGYASASPEPQPQTYYYAYRNQAPTANLYYDTVTGQYFYRKASPGQYFYTASVPNAYVNANHPNMYFTRGAPNASASHFNQFRHAQQNANPNTEETQKEEEPGGVIITEVSDDEDYEFSNKSDKKKDYVDAISLNGEEDQV